MRLKQCIPLVGGALAAGWVLFVSGPHGPGLTPDAMSYLGAAQSLVRTGHLREPFASWNAADSTSPLTDYPAGFSLALAVPVSLGASPVPSARWVEALSAGLAVGIAAWVTVLAAGETAAIVAVLVLGLMPALTDVSSMVVSEPLFLVFVSLTIWAMTGHRDRPWVAGLASALGNLVRFAGVFLVAGVAFWQLLQPVPWRLRVRRAAIGVTPAVLLHLYWRFEAIVPGGGTSAGVYSGLGTTLQEGWTTVSVWLAPGLKGALATFAAAVVLLLLVSAWWLAVRRAARQTSSLLAVCGLLGALYLGTLAFTRLYVIPDIPLDARMLLPLFFIAGLGSAATLTTRTGLGVVALWLGMSALRDGAEVGHTRAVGVEYEAADWQASPVASWLRGPGTGRVLYTNDPAGVWFTTGRPSRLLPADGSPDSIGAFRARFDSQPSALAGFDVPFVLGASPDSLATALQLVPVATFAHGVVWARP